MSATTAHSPARRRTDDLHTVMIDSQRFRGEWVTKRLGELGDISGAGVNKKVSMNEVPVRLVNYLDVYHKTFLYSKDLTHEVSAKPEHAQRCVVRKGDVFFTPTSEVRNDIGRSAVAMEDIPDSVYSYHVVRFRLKTDWDLYFRAYAFKTKEFFDQASTQCEGSGTRYVITLPRFRAMVVHFPPSVAEQRAIAEVLTDVDGLLAALEVLIAKKRAIKQTTTQQLLTGKTRLPGFRREWVTKWLGELGTFSKGRGIKREDLSDEGLPCIRYGELYTRYGNYILNVASRIPPSVALTALPIRTGDLLFAGSGETAKEIGRCAAYLGKETAYAGGDIVVLRPSEQSSIYLGHLMNHSTVSVQKVRMGQGDAVVHISASNLAQVQVKLPTLAEQQAIAAALSDMDAEIAALERRWNKTRAIKQGMMQALLTGRVRLVKPNRAAEGSTC